MAMLKQGILLMAVALTAAMFCFGCVRCEEEEDPYVAKCPPTGSTTPDFCDCMAKTLRSGLTLSIKCDFNYSKNVLLTDALFPPLLNSSLVSAYVRVVNATSVNVTNAFYEKLLQSPSIALDVWRAGVLYLESMPEAKSNLFVKHYKTFVGVGIVSCYVPEMPKDFLRDRTRGGLRIKSSHVGNFHEGVISNMLEMRYLVLEDSVVDFVEGSVAKEGYVTLSKRQLHSWNGLILTNVTIESISEGAFNITHKSDIETVKVANSKIGSVSSEAFTVKGDINVTIQDNVFARVEKDAFKVAVTGSVVFNKNTIESWESDALDGLICHNRTAMEKNTFFVSDPMDIPYNSSTTPFHKSCGNPQLFMVISIQHPLEYTVATGSSWALGVVLVFLILAAALGLVYAHQSQNLLMHYYRNRGRPLRDFRDRKMSQENLPNGAEVDPSAEATEEGMTNPIFDGVQVAS